MAEDKIEEETYSLIFTSLKHPIRRKILRMLADEPLTYSEILETLNIDSGHLSYHLESLGDLTVHDKNGHYQLSSFGEAAVKLMGGVEEQTPKKSHHRPKPRRLFAKVYPIILALFLIGASFHLVTYATVVFTKTSSTESMLYPFHTNIPFNVGVGETFEINITIEYKPPIYRRAFGVNGGVQEWVFSIPQLENTFTGWDEATIWLDSIFNLTTLTTNYTYDVPVVMWNQTSQTNETIITTFHASALSVNPNDATAPSNLEVRVHVSNGTVLTENFYRSKENRFDTSSSTPVTITKPTTYTFEITNKGSWDWNGALVANLQFQSFEKPFFYWGIAGFIIALGYVVLVTILTIRTKNKTDDLS